MRPRDIAIVAALVAIGVLAVVDAVRSRGDSRPDARRPTTAAAEARERRLAAPPVPAEGSLVIAGGPNCRIHEILVSTGADVEGPRIPTGCRIWPAPNGRALAYEDPGGSGGNDFAILHVVDLADPRRRTGRLRAYRSRIAWSPIGRRVAWCDPFTRNGHDVNVAAGARRTFARCPLAYDQLGRPVLAYHRRLVVGETTLLRTVAPVDAASFAPDGSYAILAGRRIERWKNGRLEDARTLPSEVGDEVPIFSPDNCAALFELTSEVRLVDVGCFGEADRSFSGYDGAWSPDGEWLAIADDDAVTFYPSHGAAPRVTWTMDVQDLGWR